MTSRWLDTNCRASREISRLSPRRRRATQFDASRGWCPLHRGIRASRHSLQFVNVVLYTTGDADSQDGVSAQAEKAKVKMTAVASQIAQIAGVMYTVLSECGNGVIT